MKLKSAVFIAVIATFFVWSNNSYGGEWEVSHFEGPQGNRHPVAQVKNDLGFVFNVTGAKNDSLKKAGLVIPKNYKPISRDAVFVKFQIDAYSIQRKNINRIAGGYGAIFYLNNRDISRLKKGQNFKVSYYGIAGWSGATTFTLKGSNKAISHAISHYWR